MTNKDAEQLIINNTFRCENSNGDIRLINKKQIEQLAIQILNKVNNE